MLKSSIKLQNLFILVWFVFSTLVISGLSASYGAARLPLNDYEKIKQQAIINSFKAKLVKLLGIEFMPESVFVSNMTNPLPEPILNDEHHLKKMRSNSISRRVRNKEIRNNVHFETKETDESEHLVNLNGSTVQHITLLPEKSEKDWCHELMMDIGPHRHRHFHRRTSFVTLNCMSFDLTKQKEFSENEINSADLYIRINLNKHLNFEFASHIYLEVNGILIKRINMVKLNGDETDRYGFVSQEPVFDSADVRKIVKETLIKSKEPFIRVKVLFKNDFIDTDISKLREIFSDLDENMALHVKFGRAKKSKTISKRNIYTAQKKQNSSKNQNVFRDCSELRRAGFKSNNFSCCRESIPISMDEIGWGHFIIEPKIIEYKYCRGSCLCKFFSIVKNF